MKKWLFSFFFLVFCFSIEALDCDLIVHAASGSLSASTLTLEDPDSMIMVIEDTSRGPKFMDIAEFVENWDFSNPNAALSFAFKDDVRVVVVTLDQPTYENGVLKFKASQMGKPQTGEFINGTLYVEHN